MRSRKENIWRKHIIKETFLEEIVTTIIQRAERHNRIENLKKQDVPLLLEKLCRVMESELS